MFLFGAVAGTTISILVLKEQAQRVNSTGNLGLRSSVVPRDIEWYRGAIMYPQIPNFPATVFKPYNSAEDFVEEIGKRVLVIREKAQQTDHDFVCEYHTGVEKFIIANIGVCTRDSVRLQGIDSSEQPCEFFIGLGTLNLFFRIFPKSTQAPKKSYGFSVDPVDKSRSEFENLTKR